MNSLPDTPARRPEPASSGRLDVHQHVMPSLLADALRRRKQPPYLDGWTLYRDGSPTVALPPDHFDLEARSAQVGQDGCDQALVSLSAPLGLEYLTHDQAQPLLDAYHDAVTMLPDTFRGWAAAHLGELDLDDLGKQFGRGFVGLQLPATEFATPAAVDRVGPLLSLAEGYDKPLLIHPGVAGGYAGTVPAWWAPAVTFVDQMHAAWHAWQVAGLPNHPNLRVCFVALAGLAPLHHERVRARGGNVTLASANVFYETSSYRSQTVELVRQLVGDAAIVYGSDRPYAEPSLPAPPVSSRSDTTTIRAANPHRLLTGGEPTVLGRLASR